MNKPCWFCSRNTTQKEVPLRSKKRSVINYCAFCDFEFFSHENSSLLANNQLDKTRLESAGLAIPTQEQDFKNGYTQSKSYALEYFTTDDVKTNVLEIGCSWGYFLSVVKEFGGLPFGIEINAVRRKYVQEKLNIRCEADLNRYISDGIKFKKIFSFYCLEYIKNPVDFFKKLINLLEYNGEIIFITPNLHDVLKDVWKNEGYHNFFYDECAIAYYSCNAIEAMIRQLPQTEYRLDFQVYTKQGYSIFNHLYWYFNLKPINNNCLVGGDQLQTTIQALLEANQTETALSLANLITDFDQAYKKIITDSNLGNQIIFRLQKRMCT